MNGDALETDFDDEEFDVVNDTFVFHHFEPSIRKKYASEINRILKPGGLFIMRGFSDKMTPGSGPFRLTSKDILDAFTPYFSAEHLSRFRNIPTEKRPDQWHWLGVFSKKS